MWNNQNKIIIIIQQFVLLNTRQLLKLNMPIHVLVRT